MFALILLLFAVSAHGQEVIYNGTHPPPELNVLNSHTVQLTNHYHESGSVKFSVRGVNITTVKLEYKDFWYFIFDEDYEDEHHMEFASTGHELGAKFQATRYFFKWHNRDGHGHEHEVCFDFAHNGATWYQTFLEKGAQSFPIPASMTPIVKPSPMITNVKSPDSPFGPLLEYLFYSSDGAALWIDANMALFVRRTATEFCISINGHERPYPMFQDHQYQEIYFSYIMAPNIELARDAVYNWIPLQPHQPKLPPATELFSQPIWNLKSLLKAGDILDRVKVLDLAKQLKEHGFSSGQLVFDDHWETNVGDLTFDSKRYSNASQMIHDLHQLGFKVKLPVSSFVSSTSQFHKTATNQQFLLKDPAHVPLKLTVEGETIPVNLLDNSIRYEFRHFLNESLIELVDGYGADSFRFLGGDLAQFALLNYSYGSGQDYERRYPNDFTERHTFAAAVMGPSVEVESGFKSQSYEVFTRLPDIVEPNWEALRSMFAKAMTASLGGYNFLVPGTFTSQPSEELYIRWLQAITFMPSMQFTIPPWVYSESVTNLTQKFIALHQEHSPTIFAIARLDTCQHGKPLLRPLWSVAPDDPKVYAITDQFMLGENILVAPVMVQGAPERTVYLPKGQWVDAHGKSFQGPGEFKVAVPLEELAYFKSKL